MEIIFYEIIRHQILQLLGLEDDSSKKKPSPNEQERLFKE